MASLPRNHSLKAFAFLVVSAILIAEYALIEHAIEHSFAEPDAICFVCEKADNFHNSLTASVGLVEVSGRTGYEPQLGYKSRLPTFHGFFRSRAPPASSPV